MIKLEETIPPSIVTLESLPPPTKKSAAKIWLLWATLIIGVLIALFFVAGVVFADPQPTCGGG